MGILMVLLVIYFLCVFYSLIFIYTEFVEDCSKKKRAWFWLTILFTIWFMPLVVLLMVVGGLLKDAFGR